MQDDLPAVTYKDRVSPAWRFLKHLLDLVVLPVDVAIRTAKLGRQYVSPNDRCFHQVVGQRQQWLRRRVELEHDNECSLTPPHAPYDGVVQGVVLLQESQAGRK